MMYTYIKQMYFNMVNINTPARERSVESFGARDDDAWARTTVGAAACCSAV